MLADLAKIHSAGRHLLSLINDILDLSKIEAGKMDLFVEDFELRPVVEDVVSTAQPLAEKTGARLEASGLEDLGVMRSDVTRVRQVLLNLLSNACKFTQGGTVTAGRRARGRAGALRRVGRRDRHVARAAGAAVPGFHAGGGLDLGTLRRDRPRARDQPPVLPHDGRRHRGRERGGEGLHLHRPAAGRRSVARAGSGGRIRGGRGGHGRRRPGRNRPDRRRRPGARESSWAGTSVAPASA